MESYVQVSGHFLEFLVTFDGPWVKISDGQLEHIS
jgi:hypothetical protein